MKIILPLVGSLLLFSLNSFANITSASIFREMQSTNPGVISNRQAATFSVLAKKDDIKIEQEDISSIGLPAGSSYESNINVSNYSLFYGGKGKGLTTEFFAETGAGGKKDTINEVTSVTELETTSKITNASLGLGIFDGFGISVLQINGQDKQQYNATINGNPISVDTTTDISLTGFTVGTAFHFGVDIGLFYQKADFKTKSTAQTAGGGGGDTQSADRIGGGIGISSRSFRAEVGYVKNIKATKSEEGDLNPAMAEFTLEGTLGKLKLGYTGRYLMDGFFMYKNVLYNVLAYQGNNEARLENTFNFSYGSDTKGHSISGSYSVGSVESEQTQPLISSLPNKFKTITSSTSMSLSYSYIF